MMLKKSVESKSKVAVVLVVDSHYHSVKGVRDACTEWQFNFQSNHSYQITYEVKFPFL